MGFSMARRKRIKIGSWWKSSSVGVISSTFAGFLSEMSDWYLRVTLTWEVLNRSCFNFLPILYLALFGGLNVASFRALICRSVPKLPRGAVQIKTRPVIYTDFLHLVPLSFSDVAFALSFSLTPRAVDFQTWLLDLALWLQQWLPLQLLLYVWFSFPANVVLDSLNVNHCFNFNSS